MIRKTTPVLFIETFMVLSYAVHGQDNPVLDKLVSKKIKEELSKMNSPATGYRDGAHWLHLDNPEKTLAVSVTIKQGKDRLSMTGSADGKIAFNYRVEKTETILGKRVVLLREDFGGYADAKLVIEASAVDGPQLSGAEVKIKEIRVTNLRMRSDLAKPFQGLIQDFVNNALRGRTPEFEKKIAAALNTVRP